MTDGIHPSRAEFRALARDYTVVPVWREVLADLETPMSAFVKLVGAAPDDAPGYLLESVEHGERWGRYSFLGRDPACTLVVRNGAVSADGPLPDGVPTDRGVLAALDGLLAALRAPVLDALPPFQGGIVGTLGYDTVREIERLPEAPPDPLELPDAVLFVGGHVIAFDHFRQRLFLIENVIVETGASDDALDTAYDTAAGNLDALVADLGRPLRYLPSEPPVSDLTELAPATSTMAGDRYAMAVDVAKEHILAGDIFQVVLAQRFDLEGAYEPFDVYRVLRQLNPSPNMFFVRHPELTLVGSSPEVLVRLRDGHVISRPIAGTRRRGATEDADARMAAELIEHPKERAEHVMLVDLARNDLGRVAEFGSVQVDELMVLERYSHVMHMTSQVSGKLAADKSAVDVLRATFPHGTVSGAPKVRAMEIIDSLEPVKRGPYAGVVGYLDFAGNLDTALTIRTMVFRDGAASVEAGAGIVADSDPAEEDLECNNKASALRAAAAASLRLVPIPKRDA